RMLPSRRVREGLGLTFQTNRVFSNLSIQQNLEIPLAAIRGEREVEAEDRYRTALKRFELDLHDEAKAARIPHHKRHWLAIAMVVAGGPELLLLDEPTAGMAPEETRNTAAVLRDLNRMGLTILVVEHDMAFVREIARRVTVMHQGRVFADGTIDEVTARRDVRDIYLGRRGDGRAALRHRTAHGLWRWQRSPRRKHRGGPGGDRRGHGPQRSRQEHVNEGADWSPPAERR